MNCWVHELGPDINYVCDKCYKPLIYKKWCVMNNNNQAEFIKPKWKADKALICQMAASILATREYSDYETQKYAIRRAKEIARLVEEDDEI